MIAAGAVVTTDVKPHALMMGVPAVQTGWVCECGRVLTEPDHVCSECGKRYIVDNDYLRIVGDKGF